jgi:citrate lyase subunit beta/citryl-CoA lyase
VPGADAAALLAAPVSGADVLIQELEDSTTAELRPRARAMATEVYDAWRADGAVVAVRVNPLELDGMDDLAAVMRGTPDIVALPKVSEPAQMIRLDEAVLRFEREYGIAEGSTALLANIELARGLVQTREIARASQRIIGCLLASEDLAADLGAERAPDCAELAYARQRFLVECVAAGTIAVDCPFTWRDPQGVERDTRWARRLGYKAKSAVAPEHASIINGVLTPSVEEIDRAKRIASAFEQARAGGKQSVEIEGSLVEMPTWLNAKRLLARAHDLGCD